MNRVQKAPASKSARTPPPAPPNTQTPYRSSDQVARRAYELFLARGGEHGHDVEDWLQAERELGLGRYDN
jgi:hypothetical protein